MGRKNASKAQGALEYLLLIGGAILFVVIAASIGSGVLSSGSNNTQTEAGGFFGFINTIPSVTFTPTPTAAPTSVPTPSPTPAPHSLLWNATWGSSGSDYGTDAAVDSDGNILITGQANLNLPLVRSGKILIAKFDSGGVLLWNATWGGGTVNRIDTGRGVVVDSGGNVIVTGSTQSIGAGGNDVFLGKFDGATGGVLWNVTWGGPDSDVGFGVALDSGGNIVVAGLTQSFGAGSGDAFLAKFDGATGGVLWNVTWGGPSSDSAVGGVALDSGGNAIIAGSTESFSVTPGFADVFAAKFDSGGNLLWNVTWGGASSEEPIGGVALDSSDNAMLTGYTESFGAGLFDVFVVKFGGATGNRLWNTTWGGAGNDAGEDIVVDSSGNAIVTGQDGSVTPGSYDSFLAKFGGATGSQLWNVTWGGTGTDIGMGLALDSGGDVVVTGETTSSGSSGIDVFVAKYAHD